MRESNHASNGKIHMHCTTAKKQTIYANVLERSSEKMIDIVNLYKHLKQYLRNIHLHQNI
jgi:hypothetical protein